MALEAFLGAMESLEGCYDLVIMDISLLSGPGREEDLVNILVNMALLYGLEL